MYIAVYIWVPLYVGLISAVQTLEQTHGKCKLYIETSVTSRHVT